MSDSGGLDGVSVAGVPVSTVHSPLAGIAYQLFDEGSYTRFLEAYANCDVHSDCSWAFFDYGKAGVDTHSHLGELTITPIRTDTYVAQLSDTVLSIITNASFAITPTGVDFHSVAGTPAQVWSQYVLDSSTSTITISITLLDKTPTRIPEALWLVFNSTSNSTFNINKLGVSINPTSVVYNGSAHLHGTLYDTRNDLMTVTAHNAPFLCVGSVTTPFPTPLGGLDSGVMGSGLSFNLVNNVWGTNYPLAYPFLPEDRNMFFMFDVRF